MGEGASAATYSNGRGERSRAGESHVSNRGADLDLGLTRHQGLNSSDYAGPLALDWSPYALELLVESPEKA